MILCHLVRAKKKKKQTKKQDTNLFCENDIHITQNGMLKS